MTGPKTTRADLLRLRFARHGLGAEPGSRKRASDVELLDYGVQDTGPDGAVWALLVRGAPTPTDDELALAWTLRGAPHAYRRADLSAIAVATAPYSEGDASKRIFTGSKPLREAGISALDALTVMADAERQIVRAPTVKGDLSGRLREALDEPYLRWCEPCQAIHPYELVFRLAALQAGLELEPETSPPVLRRIKGLRAPRFAHLADEAAAAHDVIRNHLRFYPGARVKGVAEYLDAPLKDVRAHWPEDAVTVTVSGVDGPKEEPRFVLPDDVDRLGESDRSDRPVLLGTYDPFMQLRDRELLVTDKARHKALWPTIGRPGAIVFDGEVLGTWRPKTAKGALTVNVEPWKRSTAKQRKGIDGEAERLAAFRSVDLAGVSYA